PGRRRLSSSEPSPRVPTMSPVTRRRFLGAAAALGAVPAVNQGADAPRSPGPLKFQLGIVTYNIAANWDLPTVLKILPQTKVPVVEFRTGHKHGVEPALSPDQRRDVRSRCRDAGVTIWGCGTTCELHSPDKAEVE